MRISCTTVSSNRFSNVSVLISILLVLSVVRFFHKECQAQGTYTPRDSVTFTEIHNIENINYWIFADFDGDGNEELITTGGEGALVSDFDESIPKSCCHIHGYKSIFKFLAYDFHKDLAPELFLFLYEGNKVWIEVYDFELDLGIINCSQVLKTEYIIGTDNNDDGSWDGKISYCNVLDVNNDGQKDILACINSAYDFYPRGLYAFDGKDGSILWDFQTAGQTFYLYCVDVDNDNKEELLINSWAPGNKHTANGMIDTISYLICLDNQGNMLWKQEMGLSYFQTRFLIDDLNNNGEKEIICTYSSGKTKDKSNTFELQIRRIMDGKVVKYTTFPEVITSLRVTDLNRDKVKEILVTSKNGYLMAFNQDLEKINSFRLRDLPGECFIEEISDYNDDGELEVICLTVNTLYVLNSSFEVDAIYESMMEIVRGMVHLFDHPKYGKMLGIINRFGGYHRASIMQLNTIEVKSDDQSVSSGVSLTTTIIVFLTGIALTLLLFKVIPGVYRRINLISSGHKEDSRFSLLESLSTFNHGQMGGKNLNRLLFLVKNYPEQNEQQKEINPRIHSALEAYNSFTSKQLNNIIDAGSRLDDLKPIIANLEKSSKQLHSQILTMNENNGVINLNKKQKQNITVTIENLKKEIRNARAGVQYHFRADLVAIVKDVLAATSSFFSQQDVKLKSLNVTGDFRNKVFFSESDLSAIIEELLNNACTSMILAGSKELILDINFGTSEAKLKLSDTGKGIDIDDMEKLFSRDYSTKSEKGGYGLYHAGQQMQRYGGKINIQNNDNSPGVTVELSLKIVTEE
jgi:signal transduction histidine kinase